jgi:hypothetical protein
MEHLIDNIANQGGLLGSLLALSILGNIVLGKMILELWKARLDDALKYRDAVAGPFAAIKDSLEFIEKKIRISKGE